MFARTTVNRLDVGCITNLQLADDCLVKMERHGHQYCSESGAVTIASQPEL